MLLVLDHFPWLFLNQLDSILTPVVGSPLFSLLYEREGERGRDFWKSYRYTFPRSPRKKLHTATYLSYTIKVIQYEGQFQDKRMERNRTFLERSHLKFFLLLFFKKKGREKQALCWKTKHTSKRNKRGKLKYPKRKGYTCMTSVSS